MMHTHLRELRDALAGTDVDEVERWARRAASALTSGQRLFACGNGGSAAEAQHLTAELTGRFEREHAPLSALALHAETSSVTAIANDYGYQHVYARQLRAHATPGDLLVSLSASGNSQNVLEAVKAAREIGVVSLSLTGPAPCALAALSDETVAVPGGSTATVQEVHLVLVHVFCAAVDHWLARFEAPLNAPLPRTVT